MIDDRYTHAVTQLQQVDLEERPLEVERERSLAAEAQYRRHLLAEDGARLEDLAAEWIELLRTSRRERT